MTTTKEHTVGKILVVDDEIELKNALVEALSAQTYEVRGYTSGDEALVALRGEDFDLLICDLMMPEMDGIALIKAALEIDPHLVAIIMTGQGTIQTAVQAMKAGAFDYVLKPFRLQSFMPVLTRAMNTRHLRRENLQLRETVALYELSQAIAFTLDPQTIISKVADAALQQTDADEVSILLPTTEGHELYVAAVRGDNRQRLLGERVPLDEGISGWVARERAPLILNGEVKDERFQALWPHPEILSAISVPIQLANKLVGTININAVNRPRPFTLGQMKALTILASTAAGALESAALYTQVQQAQEKYRSIFENAVEGVFQSTADRRFLTVNPSLARILGYESPEEVINAFTDLEQQLYVRAELGAEVNRTLEDTGVVKGFEFEAYRKDRVKIWLSLNIRLVRNRTGAEVCREGTLEDITERKRGEAERLLMFEISQGVITTPNLDELLKLVHISISKLLDAENCFVALHDPTTNLIHYEFWADKFDPLPAPRPLGTGFSSYVVRTSEPLLLTNELINEMKTRGDVIRSGRPARSWLGVPLRTSSGTIGVLALQHYENEGAYTGRDLDLLSSVGDQIALAIERKRAEDALAESEARKDAILRSALDCVITIDHDGNVIDFNPAAENTFGYASEDIVGKRMAELIIPPHARPTHEAGLARYLATGCASVLGKRIEVSAMRADKSEFPVELTITAIGELPRPKFTAFVRDLTERKRAEGEQARLNTEIKRQTDRLNTIVATVPGVVFEVSGKPGAPDNRTNFVSRYVEPMLGYTVSEWLSVPGFWLSIVHPDDRERVRKEATAEFAAGSSGGHEFRWIGKDGRLVWVRAHTIVVRGEDGEPAGVRGVVTDITDEKQVEETLREALRGKAESLALLDTILLSAPVVFAFYNRDLEYERINETLAATNGLPAEQHLGRKVHDVVLELAPFLEPYLEQVLKTGEPVIDFELRAESPVDPGRQRVWLVSFYPVRMQGGEILGVGVLVSDITDRKASERELVKSEERYRDLVENAHDIIYSQDLQGNYTSMNKAGSQIIGYTNEEALALNIKQTIAPEYLPKVQEMLTAKLNGQHVTAYEMEVIAKDGHRIMVEANTKLVYHDGLPIGVQGIARDVTERKQLEEQLRQSQKMEAIGQLAGGVAHDFNNLLTAINGYSSLALQRLEHGHPITPYLEEVKKAGDRAAILTRQLLAFGRKQILQPLAINLNDVVTDMNKMLQRLIGEDVRLTAKLDPALKRIKADPGQVEQVLVNLVVNARDAMPKGGKLTIETTTVELDSDYAGKHIGFVPGKYVMLAVSDTGTGMSEDTRARIFDPFFTTKEKGKGTGLGLSTVYGIIKQSGGNIWVYSELGHGTTFKVYLPEFARPPLKTESAVVELAPSGGSETILLVEDDDVVRGLARKILEQSGYKVVAASRGAEAISLCQERTESIDLLLTDVVMPETSGKEVADRMSELLPGLRVLFMSGYTDEAIVHHGVLDSNVEFIQKPFTPAALVKRVREVLDAESLNGQ